MASAARRTLYPAIKPYRSGWLRVSSEHEIYWEECGNPGGSPSCSCTAARARHRPSASPLLRPAQVPHRAVRPARLRPRTPLASLVDNTTWHLVADMESCASTLGDRALAGVRRLVGLARWRSPTRRRTRSASPSSCCAASSCCATGRSHWFYQDGASAHLPGHWDDYLAAIPPAERGDLVGAYYKRLTSRRRAVQLEAAQGVEPMGGRTSYLLINQDNIASWNSDDFAIAVARIECHYFVNQGFFDNEDQLLRGVRKIRHIPAVIVQGRYDVVCPMRSAWDLHQAWPEADFRVVADAGHSALEAGNTHELVSATDRFAR